jgi:hypothetical protein
MLSRINRPMLDLCARGILTKVVVAFPVRRRPDRSGHEAPTAVRADVVKDVIDTRGAERALIGADACFKRIGRQRLGAVLTGRSEFKHGVCLPMTRLTIQSGS